MKKYSKSWNDVTELFPNGICRTGTDQNPVSHFYIFRGVKIERFLSDGHIEIMNVLNFGDKYIKPTKEQLSMFHHDGFLAGVYYLNYQHCLSRGDSERAEEFYNEYLKTK